MNTIHVESHHGILKNKKNSKKSKFSPEKVHFSSPLNPRPEKHKNNSYSYFKKINYENDKNKNFQIIKIENKYTKKTNQGISNLKQTKQKKYYQP